MSKIFGRDVDLLSDLRNRFGKSHEQDTVDQLAADKIERLTAEVEKYRNALIALSATYGANVKPLFNGSDDLRLSVECALDTCDENIVEACITVFYRAMRIGVTPALEELRDDQRI